MTTFDDINNFSALLNSESDDPPPHLGFRHHPISQSPEAFLDATLDLTLAQRFQNVRLGSSSDENNRDILYNQGEEEEEEEDAAVHNTDLPAGPYHPLRLNAGDCTFYLRTGTCKFGPNCRYNHPLNPSNQVGKEEVVVNQWANNKEFLPQLLEKIECKYYLTPGGCKYGDSCRYRHSKIMTEVTPLELNFLGLPIRLGAKVCPFYMRNGTCGYGPRCKFTHPNPTTTITGGVFEPPHSSSPAGLFVAPVNGTSQQAGHANWSLPMMTGTDVALHGNNLSYLPAMPTVPHFTPEWNEFKAPEEWTLSHSSTPVETNYMTKPSNFSSGVQEYPERPGQPECVYFIKTGNCKFKSACRYHHPSNGTSQVECLIMTENGLPLRPGKKVCRHYEQYGICKFGQICLFDHPVNLRSFVSEPLANEG